MKKEIFGVVFSVCILLSLQFISPAHVKAAELQKDEMMDDLYDFGNVFAEKIDLLETIADDPAIKEKVYEMASSDNQEDLISSYNEYKDILLANYPEYNEVIEDLKGIEDDLKESIKDKEFDEDFIPDTPYYKMKISNNKITVVKTDSDDVYNNELLIMTNPPGLKTSSGEWVGDESICKQLSNFFFQISALLLMGLSDFGGIVPALVIIGGAFGLPVLIPIALVVGVLWIAALVGSFLLGAFFASLDNMVNSDSSKVKQYSLFSNRKTILNQKLQSLLRNILLFLQNLNFVKAI